MTLHRSLAASIFAIALSLILMPFTSGSASAVNWSNSHLIDDGVFDNVGTMSEADIQNFFNVKGSCLAGYNDVDPTWTGTTWTYTGSVSAAHTIYKVSRQWGLNPQVILATLQKEQSLISGRACVPPQIVSAMGYDCPDSGGRYDYPAIGVTGTCVSHQKNAGFARQVLWAGWQLKFAKERSAGNTGWDDDGDITYLGYMTQGTFKRCSACTAVAYDGNATIDGQLIHLENGATASLYSYTPHLGQSFPSIFESYFGSIIFHGDDPVGSLDLVQQAPSAVRLAGWGLDRSMTDPATIHVYIDGTWSGAIIANATRGDVGTHAFDGTVPYTGSGNHQVCAWVVGDNKGLPNAGLGCKTVSINNDPLGSLDLVRQAPSAIRLAGWGLDRSLAGPASVHVYVDGIWRGAVSADMSRGDVGVHGYDGTVGFTSPGDHQVCAWVVGDSLGASNAGLGCRTVSINNDPLGSIDLVQPISGGVRLAGWGLDRSLAGPASIHVYVDGTFRMALSAGFTRPDVGDHAFDGNITSLAPGDHQVCAWVVGDSLGAGNAGLGCRQFSL